MKEEITLEEAKKLVEENKEIGYYINYETKTLNQVIDIWSQEWRVVAKITN